MSTSAQLKTKGLLLVVSFFAVLVAIFMPLFPGTGTKKINGLDYLDNFFNELSKGSAYYIDQQMTQATQYDGQDFATTLKMKSAEEAAITTKLFTTNNIAATIEGENVQVSGDFGAMIKIILGDTDAMYHNKGATLTAKYQGINERQTIYSWYQALGAMEKDLTKSKKFAQAKFVKACMTKAIEPAYNYYKVEAKSVKASIMLVVFALAFYVIYTMWYGFGLLFLFEGFGIKLEH